MTDTERDRKMVLGYLETALMLKRSIARLRKKRKEEKRLCDLRALDTKIEGLECDYYDQVVVIDRFRHLLTAEEQKQVKRANQEVNAPFREQMERRRKYNQEFRRNRNVKREMDP